MNLCLRMNEFKLARTVIDEQLEKSPDSLAWQLHLAEVERREENLLTAIRIADQVLAQEPENEKAQKLRNEALGSLDKAHERLHEPIEPHVTEDS